jgi:RimJ/RimL family protein N-acetyltransferase
MAPMTNEEVTLRAVQEGDLEELDRFATDPSALGEFEWFGFTDPHIRRRRWKEDGLLGSESSMLAVVLPNGTFAGIVSWRSFPSGGVQASHLEIGIALLPEHRGHGLGTAAQRSLVDYLFDATLANRIQAGTEVDNVAERRALERLGFQLEGVMRGAVYRRGAWRDLALYSRLRGDPV